MSNEKYRQRDKGGSPSDSRSSSNPSKDRSTGHVKFDKRGNAVWHWTGDTGSFGLETSDIRRRRLENSTLSLAKGDQKRSAFAGYDPYQSGPVSKDKATPRNDLRKLSEWIKSQRKTEEGKNSQGPKKKRWRF